MSARRILAWALADALLEGNWTPRAMSRRAGALLGSYPSWLRPLLSSLRASYLEPPLGRRDELARAIAAAGLRTRDDRGKIIPPRYSLVPARMRPRRWPVPELTSAGDLAKLLGLDVPLLDRLADRKALGRSASDEALRSYRYRWIPKRSGGARLLEVPKSRLRESQRKVLHAILDPIPPHPAAHGFFPGRSLLGFAGPHCGQAIVLRLDLESFFASVTSARVFGIFMSAGYPEGVARVLTALCTHRTPAGILHAAPAGMARTAEERWRVLKRFAAPHLPQGAPTSPALANLCAYRLDVRLAKAAAKAGARYTRYADDLAFSFSAGVARRAQAFYSLAAGIALQEGFAVQFRKTRFAGRGASQRLAGLVVNEHLNVPRQAFDRLRATLHRALTQGPAALEGLRGSDARAELRGKLDWIAQANPARGKKLREVFEQIDWASNPTPRRPL